MHTLIVQMTATDTYVKTDLIKYLASQSLQATNKPLIISTFLFCD